MKMEVRGMTVEKLNKLYGKAFPKIAINAMTSALNKTAVTIRARTVRGVSTSSKIKPMKLIRKRTAIWRANRKHLSAGVFFRYPPMPAELLAPKSGLKWSRRKPGIRVKGRNFIGAFAATPKTGKHANRRERIYKRVSETGDPKVDLHAEYLNLKPYAKILERVGVRVTNQVLEKRFLEQFEWRMDKAIIKAQGKL